MKKILCVLVLVLLSFQSYASHDMFHIEAVENWSYSVAYNFLTFHHAVSKYDDMRTGEEKDINNDNNFIGVRVNVNQNLGIFLAKGESSVNEDSKIMGVELSQDDKTWEFGSDFGIASGYEPIVSSGKVPFVNPFLRYNQPITENSKISLKGGIMNFMAENFFIEYAFKF